VSTFISPLEAVVEGQVLLPHRLVSAGHRRGTSDGISLLVSQLTTREREVLSLLVEGADGGAIARRLGISRNTVRTHVQSILTKLQVHSRLEAATMAVRHHLVPLPSSAIHRFESGSPSAVAGCHDRSGSSAFVPIRTHTARRLRQRQYCAHANGVPPIR